MTSAGSAVGRGMVKVENISEMERKQIDIEISRTESRFKCLYYSRLTFTFASTPSRIVLID